MLRNSLEAAISLMLTNMSLLPSEKVHTSRANGRILAENIVSAIDMPPFDRSPLDGYAVKACDTNGASEQSPAVLTVIDEVYAGGYSCKTLSRGEAIRIMTGAVMPTGSDCVIAQENTDYGEISVKIYKSHSPYQNYCYKGEDIKEGTVVMEEGAKIRYIHQGILSSLGISYIKAIKKPDIALLITGDELCSIDEPLPKGRIYNSNLYLLCSRMSELGVKPIIATNVPDCSKTLASSIAKSAESADFIITTGGVSVGKKDILHDALERLSVTPVFKGLDFKPGSPAIFSMYKNKPVLSLSGNPFAAITTFELLARPILYKMTNDFIFDTKLLTSEVTNTFDKKSPTRRFVRAIFDNGGVTIPSSDKAEKHSSGSISSMLNCNCLVDIPAGNGGIYKGDKVNIILLDR